MLQRPATKDSTQCQWVPPTPDPHDHLSGPSPPPLVYFEPLPPPRDPLPSRSALSSRSRTETDQMPSARSWTGYASVPVHKREITSEIEDFKLKLAPIQGYFPDDPSRKSPKVTIFSESMQNRLSEEPVASSSGVTTMADYEDAPGSSRKRPRREAALVAKLALRQPSPQADSDSPPPIPPSEYGYQSNRKVSHSLIERRRRERINSCLATLSLVVPQCREEGEKKERKARERGRKRVKAQAAGEEEGQKNGLHKLEVLEGTILYIRQLEQKLAILEANIPDDWARSESVESLAPATSNPSATEESQPEAQKTRDQIPLITTNTPRQSRPPSSDEAARLLLVLSTSPELRPVIYL
ncbi:hypothetical protein P7C70_g1275, partial [Phenoliferia sp. Uapishka_3]